MKKLVIGLIKYYQKYKPIHRLLIYPEGACRFTPSCSKYSIESIEKYGVFRGAIQTAVRLARCNPFTAGGADSVR